MPTGRARGFAYPALLVGIVVFGIGLAKVGEWASQQKRREDERALRHTGADVVGAIKSYYYSSPSIPRAMPRSLEDLVDDKRFPVTRHHLRDVPFDPISRSKDWGIVRAPDGGVTGIYSKGGGTPLPSVDAAQVRSAYADWKFVFDPNGR
ncbi:type II secretion system protein [Ralstonia sp. A12]|uniref:type II secretion system protein n=1 Tax=Ralstonia sp. A12 TaxID=1217052 RepID=UPI000694621F|nr:type II secretion system protein [Ralstonia sp. A12]